MKTTTKIVSTLVLSSGLFASVPYTFTANTPAKASEVNANFQDLSGKIDTINKKATKDDLFGTWLCIAYSGRTIDPKPGWTVSSRGLYAYQENALIAFDNSSQYSTTYPNMLSQIDQGSTTGYWTVINGTLIVKYLSHSTFYSVERIGDMLYLNDTSRINSHHMSHAACKLQDPYSYQIADPYAEVTDPYSYGVTDPYNE